MNRTGIIYGINGPVIYLKGNTGFKMSEMVYVGKEHPVSYTHLRSSDSSSITGAICLHGPHQVA